MAKIYLVRHGQDEDNAAGRLNGRRDMPLTLKGVEQAKKSRRDIATTSTELFGDLPLASATYPADGVDHCGKANV